MIDKNSLKQLYWKKNKSMQEIANELGFSLHKVAYWMGKHEIRSRTRSEATYVKNHPEGDPFKIKTRLNLKETELLGLGMGLYWGEGHRRNQNSIRLGNTDPSLVSAFIKFLVRVCGVKRQDIGFHLMVFGDTDTNEAKNLWVKKLNIEPGQIKGKITILKSRGKGSYRHKSENGVIILQYNNKKLRDYIIDTIEKIK